jgi:hypothetical protein
MARGAASAENENWFSKKKALSGDVFCAEHGGIIASFPKLSQRISDISEFPDLAKRECHNYSKTTAVIVGALGAAAVVTPLAFSAAPAAAAALGNLGLLGAASTGTAISTLSGAALTSASLAALGGTVAGGTIVVTAAGVALGGWQGGLISMSYIGEVKNFKVERINRINGAGPAIVCVDGFLSQTSTEASSAWATGIESIFPKNPWYHLQWESKCLKDLGAMAMVGVKKGGMEALSVLAAKAMRQPAKGLGAVITALPLLRNPWHVAMLKSMMTGALVADMLCRTRQRRGFTLIWHSLGARVIFYALQALATRLDAPRVRHVILLGGAVGCRPQEWDDAAKAVSGNIINCYSRQDDVLKFLYKSGTVFSSEPIGRNPIASMNSKIKNMDLSNIISGHMQYKPCLPVVLGEIQSYLD